jgi:hypothetical protein
MSRELLIEQEIRLAKTIEDKRAKLMGFSTEYINESYSAVSKWTGKRNEDGQLLTEGEEYVTINEKGEEVIKTASYDEIDWIDGEQFPKVSGHMRNHLGTLLENLDTSIISESAQGTVEQAPFRDMIIPIYRNAFAKFKMTDYVGFIPLSQPTSAIYVEKFFYGNNAALPIQEPITSAKPRTENTAVTFNSFVIRVAGNTGVYNAIVNGSSYIKVSGGGGSNLAKIVYKEVGDTTGYIKLLVKLESGQTLPAVGTVYITGPNADTTMTHVWNNEVGKRVILKSYGFLSTTSDGENLSDYLTVNLATDSMQVNTVPYKIGFEITDEAVQDMYARHNVDIKKRLISAIQYQLAASVNMRLFNLASSNAEIGSTFTYDDADGRWGNEKYVELIRKIKYEQNRMAAKSRRGIANWLITDVATASVIEMERGFVPAIGATGERGAGIIEVGRWMSMSVAVNTFALNNFVLLGYKGDDTLVAGVFYCSYVGLSVAFATNFDNPMRKKVVFMERSAYVAHPDGADQFLSYFDISYSGAVIG